MNIAPDIALVAGARLGRQILVPLMAAAAGLGSGLFLAAWVARTLQLAGGS